MKYEFHVGDYVETKLNSFGYISHIDGDEVWWRCALDDNGYHAKCEYGVQGIEDDGLARYYNRIGQYDFTKPEQPKEIKHLGSGSLGNIFAKINELVDAVNELRNK